MNMPAIGRGLFKIRRGFKKLKKIGEKELYNMSETVLKIEGLSKDYKMFARKKKIG